jgi:cobalamin biosynthesis protein CobT
MVDCAGLRDHLKQALMAMKRSRTSRDQVCGALDMTKLATIAARVNDPTVYQTTIAGRAVNTAMHVLLDESSSMSHTIFPATAAATMVTDAAIGCGVKAKLSGFGEYDKATVFCDYGEKPNRQQWLERMPFANTDGSTPTAQHVHWAARDLLKRPEMRKILVVVTDGNPDNAALCRDMAKLARTTGIETYCVGISLHAHTVPLVQHVFGARAFVNVERPEDLRHVLIVMLAELLLRKEGRHG